MFKNGVAPFDVEAWMRAHSIQFKPAAAHNDGKRWKLDECPFNPEHRGGSAAVGRKENGALWFKCQHESCAGKGWRELREKVEPGWRSRAGRAGNKPAVGQPGPWLEPEDRGEARLSEQGKVEYVEDLIRPSRVVVWAAEEGSGKSYTVDDELAIRLATASGMFAGTWKVVGTGPVLVISEMHADDDYEREEITLASLDLDRSALKGRYYRLPLMTAAGGAPVLQEPGWRDWVVDWAREKGIRTMIFDTATGATQVDPWGPQIQEVFRSLRLMLDAYPQLAIVLIVHLKKPAGKGNERRISDVLGEWGRWCDVVVLQEADGTERTKLSTLKRVRTQRRIVATRSGGLLIDPKDLTTGTETKVAQKNFLEVVGKHPGATAVELAKLLNVTARTVKNYAERANGSIRSEPTGPKGALRYFLAAVGSAERGNVETRGNVVDFQERPERNGSTWKPGNPYIGFPGDSFPRGTAPTCPDCKRPLSAEEVEDSVCLHCTIGARS